MEITCLDESSRLYRVVGRLDIQEVANLRLWLNSHPNSVLDLSRAQEFDSAVALLLWEHWTGQLPPEGTYTDKQRMLFERIASAPIETLQVDDATVWRRRKRFAIRDQFGVLSGLLTIAGRFLNDFFHLVRSPRSTPLRELSAACYRSGVSALPITVIVGFLIGIVISYLSSLSLQDFGAESFLPLVLGVGILRELGPLLTSLVLAGRSGSAITAGLGAMRLTQELDALSALGVSHSRRLVFPRVLALALMTPLLAVCTNAAALFGGMLSGWVELQLSPGAFLYGLRADVPVTDMWIGLFKAAVFGASIGIISCYFGLSAKANTESLATNTTRSVVLSTSVIILLDAVFAVMFKNI